MSPRVRRLVVNVLETPLEISIALLSIFAGVVLLATGQNMPIVPFHLYQAAGAAVAAGGVVVIAARMWPSDAIRGERSGLALMVAAYTLLPSWFLVRVGVSLTTVQSVAADYAVAIGFALRCKTLGVALKMTRQAGSKQ